VREGVLQERQKSMLPRPINKLGAEMEAEGCDEGLHGRGVGGGQWMKLVVTKKHYPQNRLDPSTLFTK
jgi:hypothetical protein